MTSYKLAEVLMDQIPKHYLLLADFLGGQPRRQELA